MFSIEHHEHFDSTSAYQTRHENFHRKFSFCAENLIGSLGQNLICSLKCSQTIQR